MTKRFLPLSPEQDFNYPSVKFPYLYGENDYLSQFVLLLWKINVMYYLVKE